MKVAIVGTSWWLDAMYLPALEGTGTTVTAICGRSEKNAQDRARQWGIPQVFIDPIEMLDTAKPDGVIVASSNVTHHPVTKAALSRGIHVLCEKPLANRYPEAAELARMAEESGVTTMVPYTYTYMPAFRYLSELIGEGYLGRVHHINLRYHSGYGIGEKDQWKFDSSANPAGALGDLGSHMLAVAWTLGLETESVCAALDVVANDPTTTFDGEASDTAAVLLRFAGGAQGLLHSSAVAYEGSEFDQRHSVDVHGSDGTLRVEIDWDNVQQVTGARRGAGPLEPLEIPDRIWAGVRRSPVHDTYRDVFRNTPVMARAWVAAATAGETIQPDFSVGAKIQRITDAALLASAERRWVDVAEITA